MWFQMALRPAAVTLLAGGLAGLVLAEQSPPVGGPAVPSISADIPLYHVRPGDVLTVAVWKEPDLTGDVKVRLDGRITVPLVGELAASGRTPQQLSAELEGKLSRFVEAPKVTVSVSQATSARIFVIGQVNASGVFPLDGRISVLQALALAGGFTAFAKRNRILIVREQEGTQVFLRVNYKKLESGTDVGQNIILQPGDTVVVP